MKMYKYYFVVKNVKFVHFHNFHEFFECILFANIYLPTNGGIMSVAHPLGIPKRDGFNDIVHGIMIANTICVVNIVEILYYDIMTCANECPPK